MKGPKAGYRYGAPSNEIPQLSAIKASLSFIPIND